MEQSFDIEKLLAYVEGEMSDEQRLAYEQTVLQDPEIAALAHDLRQDREALQKLGHVEIPRDMVDAVIDQTERSMLLGDPEEIPPATIGKIGPGSANRHRNTMRLVYVGVAASVLLATGLTFYTVMQGPLFDQWNTNQMADNSTSDESAQHADASTPRTANRSGSTPSGTDTSTNDRLPSLAATDGHGDLEEADPVSTLALGHPLETTDSTRNPPSLDDHAIDPDHGTDTLARANTPGLTIEDEADSNSTNPHMDGSAGFDPSSTRLALAMPTDAAINVYSSNTFHTRDKVMLWATSNRIRVVDAPESLAEPARALEETVVSADADTAFDADNTAESMPEPAETQDVFMQQQHSFEDNGPQQRIVLLADIDQANDLITNINQDARYQQRAAFQVPAKAVLVKSLPSKTVKDAESYASSHSAETESTETELKRERSEMPTKFIMARAASEPASSTPSEAPWLIDDVDWNAMLQRQLPLGPTQPIDEALLRLQVIEIIIDPVSEDPEVNAELPGESESED